VLVNLTGNAIKFTEKGEVVISASCGEDGLVHFEIADTGIRNSIREAVAASSRRSSRPTVRRRADMAAPVSASRSRRS
jgi:K+-sensing histidine kinase KdpD